MVYLINTAEQERSVERELFSTVKKFLQVIILHCSTEETDIQIWKYSFKTQPKVCICV